MRINIVLILYLIGFGYCLPLEPMCSKFDYDYKTLEAMIRTERYVEDIKKDMLTIQEDVREKLSEYRETLAQFKKEVDANTLQNSDVIAFSVADATRSHVNGVPTFGRVITNIGDGYNQVTGKFTCTVPGLYLFTFTIASTQKDLNTHCRIQLNSKNIVISQTIRPDYSTSSNAVFLMLFSGDVVSLGSCAGIDQLYNTNGATSFSGALISRQ